jgi:hypothetical protein
LDRPIFDDASPLKRPWPPKHGERSARDALEAAEEEDEAAAAGPTQTMYATPAKSGNGWRSFSNQVEVGDASGGSGGEGGGGRDGASPSRQELASPPPPRRLRHEGLRVLLCGWRRDVKDMLLLMEQVLPPGSTVRILSERPPAFVDEYLADHCSAFTRVTVGLLLRDPCTTLARPRAR